jgi:hypothetical protein
LGRPSTSLESGPSRFTRKIRDAEHQRGEWSHLEIGVAGGALTVRVNDEIVNAGTGPVGRRGRIAIQSAGVPIHCRNERITRL